MVRALIAAVLLAGCAHPVPTAVRPAAASSPVLHADCAPPAPEPPDLPRIRTVAQLGAWAVAADRGRAITAYRLDECRERLRQVETWARQEMAH